MRFIIIALVLIQSTSAQVKPKYQVLRKKEIPSGRVIYNEVAHDWGQQGILFEWSEELKGKTIVRHYDLYDTKYNLVKSFSTELTMGLSYRLSYDKKQTENNLTILYAPHVDLDGISGDFTVVQINRKNLELEVSSGNWPGAVEKVIFTNDNKILGISNEYANKALYKFDMNSGEVVSLSLPIPNMKDGYIEVLDIVHNQFVDGFLLPVLHYSEEINDLYLMSFDAAGVLKQTSKVEKDDNVIIHTLSARVTLEGVTYLLGGCTIYELEHLFMAKIVENTTVFLKSYAISSMEGYNEVLGKKKGIGHKRGMRHARLLYHHIVQKDGSFVICGERRKIMTDANSGLSWWQIDHAFIGGMSKDGELLWTSCIRDEAAITSSFSKERTLDMVMDNKNRLMVFSRYTEEVNFWVFSEQGKFICSWEMTDDDFEKSGTWFKITGAMFKKEDNIFVFHGHYFGSKTSRDKNCFMREVRFVIPN